MPDIPSKKVENKFSSDKDDEILVGEDIHFQRKWWKFEIAVWWIFLLIVVLDIAGVFGRGPVAKASANTKGGLMVVNYERIERFSTPSILTIHFGPAAVTNGQIRLWVNDSVVTELGNQRVVPQPTQSVIGNGGILYTFSSTPLPDSVEFALQPSRPGVMHLKLQIPGATPDDAARDVFETKIFVMP